MNTVPFNYDLIKEGYKVVTRGGVEVKDVHLFSLRTGFPLYAQVGEYIRIYNKDGFHSQSAYDLLMIPPTTEIIASVYEENVYRHETLERANAFKGEDCLYQLKETYQNGKIISVELIKP